MLDSDLLQLLVRHGGVPLDVISQEHHACVFVFLFLFFNKEYLHILTAHETHRLEHTIIALIPLKFLLMDDCVDGGAILHHLS